MCVCVSMGLCRCGDRGGPDVSEDALALRCLDLITGVLALRFPPAGSSERLNATVSGCDVMSCDQGAFTAPTKRETVR